MLKIINKKSPKFTDLIRPLIKDEYFMNGIKINENIFAFSSNGCKKSGEDKLIFYNLMTKKIINEIKNYSFTNSKNGLHLMSINTNNSKTPKKLLLCGCNNFKIRTDRKNGILLVDLETIEDEEIYYEFYETIFQVNCFCQIVNCEKIDTNKIFSSKKSFKESDHFYTGGYDAEKDKGIIYLYKLLLDEGNHAHIKPIIEVYDEDLNPNLNPKVKHHLKSINCITQCKNEKNTIIITSSEGLCFYKYNGLKILNK